MIRRLTEEDHDQCLRFLIPKSAENTFILGDIEAYGYDQDFQKLWGDFDEAGNLRAVLLKYQGNYLPYAESPDFDQNGFASIISKDPDLKLVSGLQSITQWICPKVKRNLKKKRELYYCKCDQLLDDSPIENCEVKRAELQDVEQIVALHRQVPEFDNTESVTVKKRNMEKGVSRTYYIEQDGKMVSAASTAAENSFSAMVVGVCTLEAYQQRGYASACVKKLCQDILAEGKELCLFYDNPAAGRIYKRLGFYDIEKWSMYIFK